MKLFLFAIILIILVAVVTSYCLRLRKEARRCSLQAKLFLEKLAILSSPTHLFTDEELKKLKREFDPLLDAVNRLYDSHFISNSYLDELNLHEFLDKRKLLNHIQMVNNQTHQK